MKKAKVLVVDDHPIAREGIAQLINHQPDLAVCAEADDVPGALEQIERLEPDVAVVDLSLKGRSGLDLIKSLKGRAARLPVLVLSMHDEMRYAERALRAGAMGYIMKDQAREKVVAAIRRVLSGEVFVSDRMAARLLKTAVHKPREAEAGDSIVDRLSDRELEVFQLIGSGRGTRQIAEQLNLSVKTVETYRGHIMEKLNLGSAAEMVREAVRWLEREAGSRTP